jgi:hypothetical protein
MKLFLSIALGGTLLYSGLAASVASASPPSANQFYKKSTTACGLKIACAASVPDAALRSAQDIVSCMLSQRPDIARAMVAHNVKVAIIGADQVTTDIPEHADLNAVFKQWDWNTRTRGVGATEARPVTSCGEENLLQYPVDRYHGECILIHEFGHTVLEMGIKYIDPSFVARVDQAYRNAIAAGKWKNTYAGSNANEYWAEGVQDWFDANLWTTKPNGIHNEIHTRDQLRTYDPELYSLLSQVFPSNWKWSPQQHTMIQR